MGEGHHQGRVQAPPRLGRHGAPEVVQDGRLPGDPPPVAATQHASRGGQPGEAVGSPEAATAATAAAANAANAANAADAADAAARQQWWLGDKAGRHAQKGTVKLPNGHHRRPLRGVRRR